MYLRKLKIDNLELKTNIFIAPLAGYTNLPTRGLYRAQGAGIAYAEMVSAEGLNYNYKKSLRLIDTDESDSPLGVQLFGADSDRIQLAFESIKDEDFDLVDLNCGCSVKKILRARSGAYLLQDPDEIYRIISKLKEVTDKPVTLKIRSGWDARSLNYLDVLEAAVSAKASLITLHPRTRSMLFNGKADWSHIKELKEKSPLPVIGNGDILTGADAVRMMEETGCDGVMLARGVLENPFLTAEVMAAMEGREYVPPTIRERVDAAIEHCRLQVEYIGEKRGILEFRKFFRGYIKGLDGASKIRQEANRIEQFEPFREMLESYYNHYCSE